MSAEERLAQRGLTLPPPPRPVANYVPAVQVGNLLFLAGHVPRRSDGSLMTGKVGRDLTPEQGYEGARLTALNLLATLKATLGSLDRVERVVQVRVMVNADPDFGQHPKVADGCTDLLVEVFGEAGRPARAAVGVGSLPGGACVEIEMVVAVR